MMESEAPESGSCDRPFQFWNELCHDIERYIAQFLCIDDLQQLLMISKKFNKMIIKWVYNQCHYNQSFDSTIILPAIKHSIIVQYFPVKKPDENNDDNNGKRRKRKEKLEKIKRNKKTIGWIKLILSKNVTISKWFLNYLMNNTKYLIYNLLISFEIDNQFTFKRVIFAGLLVNALKTLKAFELDNIRQVNTRLANNNSANRDNNENNKNNVRQKKEKEVSTGKNEKPDEMIKNQVLSLKFLNLLVSFIDEIVPSHVYSMQQFWSIFEEVLMFDHEYRYYFVNIEFMSILGDFYMRERSPYAKEIANKKYVALGASFDLIKFDPVVHLISILTRSCHSPATFKRHSQAIKQLELKQQESENSTTGKTITNVSKSKEIIDLRRIPANSLSHEKKEYLESFDGFNDHKCLTLLALSQRDSKLLHQRLFWFLLMKHGHNFRNILIYATDMFCHWCFEDEQFSYEIIKLILEGIDCSDSNHVEIYLFMMQRLVSITQDTLFEKRFKRLFNCHDDHDIDTATVADLYGITIDMIDIIDFYKDAKEMEHKYYSFLCVEKIVECMQNNNELAKSMFDIRDNRWIQWDLWLKNYCICKNDNGDNGAIQLRRPEKKLHDFWHDYCDLVESFGCSLTI